MTFTLGANTASLAGYALEDALRTTAALGAPCANGVIDFPRLVERLGRSNYTGLWILELEEPDREAALVRSRDYLAGLASTLL